MTTTTNSHKAWTDKGGHVRRDVTAGPECPGAVADPQPWPTHHATMPLEWNALEGLFCNPYSLTDVFSTICEKNVWGQDSGLGSNPEVSRPYMLFCRTS